MKANKKMKWYKSTNISKLNAPEMEKGIIVCLFLSTEVTDII